MALDPLAPGVRSAYAFIALASRRYDVARQEAARVLTLEPSLLLARQVQALGALLAGDAAHCTTLSLGPYVAVRAMCLHTLGRVQEAAQLADSLRTLWGSGVPADSIYSPVIAARGLAEYYAWTGNADESLAWLERAYALSPDGEGYHFIASGLYDKVRNDPRFTAGLRRIHTQIYDRVQQARRKARLP